MAQRVLAGPPPYASAESLVDHEQRLGPRPTADGLDPDPRRKWPARAGRRGLPGRAQMGDRR